MSVAVVACALVGSGATAVRAQGRQNPGRQDQAAGALEQPGVTPAEVLKMF